MSSCFPPLGAYPGFFSRLGSEPKVRVHPQILADFENKSASKFTTRFIHLWFLGATVSSVLCTFSSIIHFEFFSKPYTLELYEK